MAKKKKRRGEMREIPLEDIKQGPIRHKKGLTPVLEKLARAIFAKVGHFVYPTFEQWELGFMRDKQPWREILIWETIARTFDLYVAEHPEAADSDRKSAPLLRFQRGRFPKMKRRRKRNSASCSSKRRRNNGLHHQENRSSFLRTKRSSYSTKTSSISGMVPFTPISEGMSILAESSLHADIIVGMASKSEEYFCIYGRDHLEDGGIPKGFKTLVVSLDTENQKAQELEKSVQLYK